MAGGKPGSFVGSESRGPLSLRGESSGKPTIGQVWQKGPQPYTVSFQSPGLARRDAGHTDSGLAAEAVGVPRSPRSSWAAPSPCLLACQLPAPVSPCQRDSPGCSALARGRPVCWENETTAALKSALMELMDQYPSSLAPHMYSLSTVSQSSRQD